MAGASDFKSGRASPCRRGQLSLELLLVFSVFLAILLISLSSLSRIKSMWDEQFSLSSAKLALNDIANAADEACVMGEGNRRTVRIASPQISFSLEAPRNLIATLGNKTVGRQLLCDASMLDSQVGGMKSVIIENDGNSILISAVQEE